MRQVKLLALMITLVFILTGCSGIAGKAENITEEFKNAEEILLTAAVCADYGEKQFNFKITCTKNAEETAIEIKEPKDIAGIRAVCKDGGYELQYDGVVMTTGTITRNGLSPAEALPFLIDQWQTGYITGAAREYFDDRETLALDTHITDSISQRTWFDEKTLLPVRSEIWENGIAVIICEFENVIIE